MRHSRVPPRLHRQERSAARRLSGCNVWGHPWKTAIVGASRGSKQVRRKAATVPGYGWRRDGRLVRRSRSRFSTATRPFTRASSRWPVSGPHPDAPTSFSISARIPTTRTSASRSRMRDRGRFFVRKLEGGIEPADRHSGTARQRGDRGSAWQSRVACRHQEQEAGDAVPQSHSAGPEAQRGSRRQTAAQTPTRRNLRRHSDRGAGGSRGASGLRPGL